MEISYTIHGVTLSISDLIEIDRYYEAACTASYILDTYAEVKTEEQAMELGYDVRRMMDKYGYSEEDAIEVVLSKLEPASGASEEVKIMLGDLTPEAQMEVMRTLGISSSSEGNFDVLPLFTVCKPESQDDTGEEGS